MLCLQAQWIVSCFRMQHHCPYREYFCFNGVENSAEWIHKTDEQKTYILHCRIDSLVYCYHISRILERLWRSRFGITCELSTIPFRSENTHPFSDGGFYLSQFSWNYFHPWLRSKRFEIAYVFKLSATQRPCILKGVEILRLLGRCWIRDVFLQESFLNITIGEQTSIRCSIRLFSTLLQSSMAIIKIHRWNLRNEIF